MGSAAYLDTNVLIAIVEGPSPLNDRQRRFIDRLDRGLEVAVTSEIALSECLVKPLANASRQVIEAYLSLFTHRQALLVVPVDRPVLIKAAELRSISKLSLPDAIHVASAELAECAIFVTGDRRIKAFSRSISTWDEFDGTRSADDR